jgi:hypothetical protein
VTSKSWSPQPGLVGLAWALGILMALAALLSGENAGRLLLGLAAAGLLLLGACGTLVRPRLRADGSGLSVRGLTGHRHWPWHQVKVRLVHTRRLGRETQSLELDCRAGEQEDLVVLTRLDLGADPEEVANVLHALRP